MGKELYITATEAAKMLCLTKESIYQYIKSGVLDGCNRTGRVYVLKSSIRQYVKMNTSTLEDKQRCIEELNREIDSETRYCNALRSQLKQDKRCLRACMERNDYMVRLMGMRYLFPKLVRTAFALYDKCPDSRLLCNIFNDVVINANGYMDVAEKYHLSKERIRQLVNKAFHRMEGLTKYSELVEQNKGLIDRNMELERENSRLTEEVKSMERKMLLSQISHADDENGIPFDIFDAIDKEVKAGLKDSMLGRKIEDLTNSTKLILVSERHDVVTLYDLARMKRIEFSHLRGAGRKTVLEAEELLEAYGLKFGMSLEDMYLYTSNERNGKDCV